MGAPSNHLVATATTQSVTPLSSRSWACSTTRATSVEVVGPQHAAYKDEPGGLRITGALVATNHTLSSLVQSGAGLCPYQASGASAPELKQRWESPSSWPLF
ncbi:hypothetical protein NDU88_003226 [Pleurodeles waltl]|uniref:Uncharacterized protein n=1 Tax=Pleurodeles waltl TaxID=8319 RepID=A0AAV7PBN8_PLEWA|nr:hypothetical protein NDU88_003226 [Pleurodeles waltl]